MLKLGVTRREQFLSLAHRSPRARLLSIRAVERVAYTLLGMPPRPSPQDIEAFERLMPYVRLSSGTYRTTSPGRFRNLDPEVNELLSTHFNAQTPLEVEDWAASACLTSSEWAQSLFPLFPRSKFVASDILLFLVELRDASQGTFVFEPGGAPLQFIKPPFVIRMTPPERWVFTVNRFLGDGAWRRWRKLNPLPDSAQTWIASDVQDPLDLNGARYAKLSLIHPNAAELARADSRFSTRRQSVFEPLSSPVHVIRTMNIFNRAYFSEQQLLTGAKAVLDSLLPGGIWTLGRTVQEDPPVHEVTIFRKEQRARPEIVKRIGPGSEIESLVRSSLAP
ncbi:MAG: hypothetical protein JO051_04435 [Acidobacteriaceae bacterium]|nr:hypothetical protein [Acidobacteriaceae bacterium]